MLLRIALERCNPYCTITVQHRCGAKCGVNMTQQIIEIRARSIKPEDKPIALCEVPGLRLEPGSARQRQVDTAIFFASHREVMGSGIGVYPEVWIADTPIKVEQAKAMIASGADPGRIWLYSR